MNLKRLKLIKKIKINKNKLKKFKIKKTCLEKLRELKLKWICKILNFRKFPIHKIKIKQNQNKFKS